MQRLRLRFAGCNGHTNKSLSSHTQALADELAVQVAAKVFDLAGGTGEPPTRSDNFL